jgi:hypothetical protein
MICLEVMLILDNLVLVMGHVESKALDIPELVSMVDRHQIIGVRLLG